MTSVSTTAERSLNAEIRGVENGHQARLSGSVIRVKSDTTPGLAWIVTTMPTAVDAPVVFRCEPSDPNLAYGRGHMPLIGAPGACGCQHAARAARRMERAGLIRWVDGRFVATAKAAPVPVDDGDPFRGFPTA